MSNMDIYETTFLPPFKDYTGLVARDYGLEPIIFLPPAFNFVVWEILSIAQIGFLK